MNGWIGVDLDGTLAHYDGWQGVGHIGKPIKPMCDRVRAWLAQGRTVKIFTARVHNITAGPGLGMPEAQVLAPIEGFCMTEFGQSLEVTNIKDYGMVELWDDRAVQLIPNTGERVDGKV